MNNNNNNNSCLLCEIITSENSDFEEMCLMAKKMMKPNKKYKFCDNHTFPEMCCENDFYNRFHSCTFILSNPSVSHKENGFFEIFCNKCLKIVKSENNDNSCLLCEVIQSGISDFEEVCLIAKKMMKPHKKYTFCDNHTFPEMCCEHDLYKRVHGRTFILSNPSVSHKENGLFEIFCNKCLEIEKSENIFDA
jgi:hypothetical protein